VSTDALTGAASRLDDPALGARLRHAAAYLHVAGGLGTPWNVDALTEMAESLRSSERVDRAQEFFGDSGHRAAPVDKEPS
jgi:hypothetical protein